MQIRKELKSWCEDTRRTGPGSAQAVHCPRHLVVKAASQTFLSLLFIYSFQGNQERISVRAAVHAPVWWVWGGYVKLWGGSAGIQP